MIRVLWRLVQAYAAISIVALFLIVILVRSNWNTSDRFVPNAKFIGCYNDAAGNKIDLSPDGRFQLNGVHVGEYEIDAPVGGKHGYLLDTSGFDVAIHSGQLSTKPSSDGFLWPISRDGEISVIFAPDHKLTFRKSLKC
jgi:hypothetical protein